MAYKYHKVYREIKFKIQNNFYKPNTLLPPENKLAEDYKVSRITIRNALYKLIDEGYINAVPGKGNYVLPKENNKFIITLQFDKILRENYNKVKLLGSNIIKPTIELVYHLHVHPDSRIVVINWGTFNNSTPISYEIQYIPYFPGITIWEDDFEYTNFGDIIRKRNNVDITHEHVEIKALNCNSEIATKLDIEQNTPVMLIIQKVFNQDQALGLRLLYIKKEWCKIIGQSDCV